MNRTWYSNMQQDWAQTLISRLDETTQWEEKSSKRRPKRQRHSHYCKSNKTMKLHNHNLYTEDLVQTQTGSALVPSVSLSPCEPSESLWLSLWLFSHGVLYPSGSYNGRWILRWSSKATMFLNLQVIIFNQSQCALLRPPTFPKTMSKKRQLILSQI